MRCKIHWSAEFFRKIRIVANFSYCNTKQILSTKVNRTAEKSAPIETLLGEYTLIFLLFCLKNYIWHQIGIFTHVWFSLQTFLKWAIKIDSKTAFSVDVEHFSDLRISYLFKHYETTEKRRQKLYERYHFNCDCPECLNVENDQKKISWNCKKCKGCVPSVTGICIACKNVQEGYSSHHGMKLELKTEAIPLDPDRASSFMFQNAKLYKRAMKIFHPFDSDLMDMLGNYYEFSVTNNIEQDQCLDILKMKLIHFQEHYPLYHNETGKLEMQIAKFCNNMYKPNEAEEHIKKAKEILEINLGADHPFLDKYLVPLQQEIDLNKDMKKMSLRKNRRTNCK